MHRRWLQVVMLSGCLLGCPLVAHGQQPAPPAPTAVAQPPAGASVADLVTSGRAKYDARDYEGAIADWERANQRLGGGDTTTRATLVFDLSTAYLMAQTRSDDVVGLHKARLLLRNYRDTLDSESEQADVDAWMAIINRRISQRPAPAQQPPPELPPPEPQPPVDLKLTRLGGPDTAPLDDDTRGSNDLLAVGGGLLVIGVAGVVMIAAGLSMRGSAESDLDAMAPNIDDELVQDYEKGGEIAFGGIIVAAVAIPLGVGVIIADQFFGGDVAVAPVVGPQTAGGAMRVRF